MKWIGLSGGIATGKSAVAKILRELGYPVVDADALARRAVEPGSAGLQSVVEIFGEKVLKSSGELDRSALGQIIFSNPEAREQLEKILHPRIQELRAAERRELERRNIETAFYDVPLLFEKNLQSEFDATVLVYAKPETQRRRLKERDHLSEDEIQKRLGAQWPIDEKVKLANYVIINEDGLAELRANVLTVLSDLKIQTGL